MPTLQGLKRNPIDKFYTKDSVAKLCIDKVKQFITFDDNPMIIEPSAGGGAFIPSINKLSNNCVFLDIEPEHVDIKKQDFLKYIPEDNHDIHIIGNPPFGRQSSTAIKFIKHACKFAQSISFILPKSFKKDSMRKHFNRKFHLCFETNIDENSFMLNNKEYDVPCVFQIWIKKNIDRPMPKKAIPNGFQFVKRDDADISFRRVGVNAGNVSTDISDKSPQSHYFIKFDSEKNIEEMINMIDNLSFDHDNTVGPKSISKQELISAINQNLN